MRRLAAVVLAAASIFGSSRLWADALTPERVPFAEPFASSAEAAEPSVVVAAAHPPHASRLRPRAVPDRHVKAVAASTIVTPISLARVATPKRRAPTPSRTTTRPKAAPKPASSPHPTTPAPATPTPAPVAPTPVTPGTTAASAPAPVTTPPVPPAPPVVEPAAQPPESRPGNGYGDQNHSHSGPPGQPGN
jgi:hypothetical protein